MGQFDQTARRAVKLDGPRFFGRALRDEPVKLRFVRWEDARRLPFPGDPDREDDAVARLAVPAAPEEESIWPVEAQTEPDPDILERYGIYGLMARQELRGARGKLPVDGVLIQLTGTAEQRLAMSPRGRGGMNIEPVMMDLGSWSAAATLAEVEAGQTGRCFLVFIPLMTGGGEPGIIADWLRIAAGEPDVRLRTEYGALALVFAELTRGLVDWQRALEGWNVRESQVIKGFKDEGKVEGRIEARREDLLKVIRARLQNPVPDPVRLAVEGTNDPDILSQWFDAALTAKTLEELRATMKVQP
jgi:hypothetical protein